MKKTLRQIETTILVVLAALMFLGGTAEARRKESKSAKPNVILLVTDDMGWGDPSSYGFDRGVKTPNLDRIAEEGIRFTNWYAEASCTPGRAAIQTGRIPMRSALTVAHEPIPPFVTKPLRWPEGI